MEKETIFDSENINQFLLQMSDDIIFMNIKEQIKNCNNVEEDYFSLIIDKIEGLRTVVKDDETDIINNLDSLKDEICDNVQSLLEERYKFKCDFKCYSDRSKCLKQIYKFFVIRHDQILLSLITNYIDREYTSLLMKYGKSKINKKDISYINNKKTMNKENLALILNLHKVFSSIVLEDIDDTLELLIEDKEEFTYNFIYTMYQQEEIVFDIEFLEVIKQELIENNDYLIMEGRTFLMNKIKENENKK